MMTNQVMILANLELNKGKMINSNKHIDDFVKLSNSHPAVAPYKIFERHNKALDKRYARLEENMVNSVFDDLKADKVAYDITDRWCDIYGKYFPRGNY